MTRRNFEELSIVIVLPILLAVLSMGCDSSHAGLKTVGDGAVGAGSGGISGQATTIASEPNGTGGVHGTGGPAGPVGTTGMGGAIGMGGVAAATGGTTPANTGGTASLGIDAGPGGATMATPPAISDSGYVTLSAGTVVLVGFISSATAGSGSSIALTYGTSDFCASGTVAANSTYKSWANAGFSVNQDLSGASGASKSLVLSGSTISISYVNRAGSQLEFQFYDGSNYWCYMLPPSATPSTKTIPFSTLNTACWDGSGSPFISGTAITSVSLVVPGSAASPTAFDFCFLGLTINE
jgi:hypothetical protein